MLHFEKFNFSVKRYESVEELQYLCGELPFYLHLMRIKLHVNKM